MSDLRAEFTLHPGPQAPRHTRALTATLLIAWNRARLLDDATLILTELTTNAITHGTGPITVTLTAAPGYLILAVSDNNPHDPLPQPASTTGEHGRGLAIIAALTATWGITRTDDGKQVWARLADTPTGSHNSTQPISA